jgi:hypothetical protein
MSQSRRQRRMEERLSKKMYQQIRIETLKKLETLPEDQKQKLAEEYNQFIKDRKDGLQLR